MLWLLLIVASVAVTLAVCAPASWLASLVEQKTGGRLTLGDAQGTLWRGSAFVGGAASGNGPVTPLLLIGMVDLRLENPDALAQPVTFKGGWKEWQLSPSALLLPADGLAGLGAPLNTVAPTGTLRLSWTTLALGLDHGVAAINGRTTLEMSDMASSLSAIRPLGSYALALDWHGQQAQLNLSSQKGPLLLSGTGSLNNGHLQFSGQAQAAEGYEETLANLLNLLGQRRSGSDKNIIALEFR